MSLIDIRVQEFLTSCMQAKTIPDVDFSSLEFFGQIQDWLRNHSKNTVTTPLAIANIMKRAGAQGGNRANGGGGGRNTPPKAPGERNNRRNNFRANKRKSPDQDNDGGVSENPSLVAEWTLKSGESMSPFHIGIPGAPKHNGKTICIKWRVRGVCDNGQDCARKDSHCVLGAKTAKEMTAWVKTCRSAGAEAK